MIVRIMGRFWKLRYCRMRSAWGECDPPDATNKEIRITRGLSGQHELEILLHEMIHAAAWIVFDESFVERLARDMSRVLHRLGYRKIGGPDGGEVGK